MGITSDLIDRVDAMARAGAPDDARIVARHCLLDWFGCAIAGSREPLAQILTTEALEAGDAALIGRCERAGMLSAALINGAASHALDFDDTHTMMSGHPSVPVVPSALALAEREGIGGAAFVDALIAGIETECRLGALLNPGHYALGFHATGTLGTFGAAMACARLLGLDHERTLQAMALAGTQAAGLKSGFGTMAKPLHAGRAAQNGLVSALLARGGYTGNTEIIETRQGFAATHGGGEPDPARLERIGERFVIRDTLFKYHASCYLTHAPIEAALSLRREGLRAEEIESVEILGSAECIGVCDIEEPQTGLEGKFSLRATTAMALLGDDTGDPEAFTDERLASAELRGMLERVTYSPQQGVPSTRGSVRVTAGGRELYADADTGRPAADLGRQWEALSAKFFGLASPVIGRERAEQLRDAIDGIETAASMRESIALARPAS